MKATIINETKFRIKNLKEIVSGLLVGQNVPEFYLICIQEGFKGVALTNLDKPTVIIFIKDLGQFAETFVHELIHIQQHTHDYADEKEVRELVITK